MAERICRMPRKHSRSAARPGTVTHLQLLSVAPVPEGLSPGYFSGAYDGAVVQIHDLLALLAYLRGRVWGKIL